MTKIDIVYVWDLSWPLLLNQIFFTEFETLDDDDDGINV